MPMENWRMVSDPTDRRRSPRLSVLIGMAPDAPSRYPATRSPRNFDPGAVGLGIVAAMSEPARSEPIPIISGRAARPVRREEEEDDDDETMLLESYTCVISHAGGNPVRKRVYLDDGCGGMGGNYARSWGLSFEPPPTTTRIGPPAPASDFLSRCYLCKKRLHGLDIFMYRGEMAFCSAECRCQQIVNEEQQRGSEARKPFACSVSPCSTTTPTPLTFAAGLVAA